MMCARQWRLNEEIGLIQCCEGFNAPARPGGLGAYTQVLRRRCEPRDPYLDDEERARSERPSFGNPFRRWWGPLTSLTFVHTARRSHRLSGLVNCSDRCEAEGPRSGSQWEDH